MKALVASVLITTYNRHEKLRRAILSAATQQHLSNYEIIVVDDGSSTATQAVISELARELPHLKYFRHVRNFGNAAARNTAWRIATGEFIAFLDDDDYWTTSDKLATQIDRLRSLPCPNTMSCTRAREFDGQSLSDPVPSLFPSDIGRHLLVRNGVIYTSTAVMRRSTLQQLGGFDEQLPRGLDSDLYRRLVLHLRGYIDFMEFDSIVCDVSGEDRITTRRGPSAALEHVRANGRVIRKHWRDFVAAPSTLVTRLRTTARASLLSLVGA